MTSVPGTDGKIGNSFIRAHVRGFTETAPRTGYGARLRIEEPTP